MSHRDSSDLRRWMAMVSEQLIDPTDLSFEEWAVTPSEEDLVPESTRRSRQSERFQPDLVGDLDAVIVTHGDADGLTSAALAWITEGGANVAVTTVSYNGAYTFETALQDLIVSDVEDTPIYILDFNPDGTESVTQVEQLVDNGNRLTWYDHHQWGEEMLSVYSNAGARITIDVDECTASLMLRDLDWSFPERIRELVEVTKDRDLWINDDPRGEDLATFAEIAKNPYEYIQTVSDYGPDLPDDVQQRVREEQELNERLKEFAVSNVIGFHISGYHVRITYVSGGVPSEIGNELCENLDADIALVLRPSGGVSIYSHSDRETFAKCHEVAKKLGGGGHPTASGFGVDFKNFRDMANYWATEGRSHHPQIIEAIDEVAGED